VILIAVLAVELSSELREMPNHRCCAFLGLWNSTNRFCADRFSGKLSVEKSFGKSWYLIRFEQGRMHYRLLAVAANV
jgi:hypothetical protein